jgi:hypothetical protein
VAEYWATRLEVFCDGVDGWWHTTDCNKPIAS